jgi:hypothetical protein
LERKCPSEALSGGKFDQRVLVVEVGSIKPLPGYAPDVNPIERVWGNLKSTELANLCSHTISEVANMAHDGLDRIGSDAALRFAFLHQGRLRV